MPKPTERELTALARQVVDRLRLLSLRIVLAESCTGGPVSALLTRIPGVSEFHCGSAVVYQIATKAEWLGVPKPLLQNPGPVSREVATKMVEGALAITPHANIAAGVTGHLGPGAPPGQDGLVYISFARRVRARRGFKVTITRHELAEESGDAIKNPERQRLRRQRSAAAHVLSQILAELAETD